LKILVIWEEIPEKTSLYLLDVEDKKELTKIKKAHGHYLNYDGYEDSWLCLYLEDKEPLTLVKGKPFNLKDVDLIVLSGIGL